VVAFARGAGGGGAGRGGEGERDRTLPGSGIYCRALRAPQELRNREINDCTASAGQKFASRLGGAGGERFGRETEGRREPRVIARRAFLLSLTFFYGRISPRPG